MTISRDGSTAAPSEATGTSVARDCGTVSAGALINVTLAGWHTSTNPTITAGFLTKTAGSATLRADGVSLDRVNSGDNGDSSYSWNVQWSFVVETGGTLTMTAAGFPSGSSLAISHAGAATTVGWGTASERVGSRVNGQHTATNGATALSTGNVTTTADSWMVAGLTLNNGAAVTITQDGSFSNIANNGANGASVEVLGHSDRLATGALTDSCDWTFTALDGASYNGQAATLVAYQETASASVEQEGFRFGVDDGSESAHTWAQAQDTNHASGLAVNVLLRVLLNASGDFAATAFALRYQKNGSGGYVAVPVGATSSPTISWGAAGTIAYSASGGTSVAPTYPSGITTRSSLVLVVGQKPSSANGGTVTTPSGWTLQGSLTGANDGDTGGYTTTLGADTGNCNIFVYTKDSVSGSESGTLSVTVGTNNVCWANIYRIEASDDCSWSYAIGTGKDTSAGSVSIATGSMSIAAGDHILAGMVIPTDVSTPTQFSSEALSQSGTTFGAVNEVEEPDSGTGNDIGGFIVEAGVSSGSGSGAVTLTATAGGTTTNVRGPGFVLRVRATGVAREVYVATSSNIASGGEATTARLTAPSGKSTSDFVTGRRWDDENGADSIDITADDYTEVEWCLQLQSPASGYYDFRAYAGASALGTYTVTPRLTVDSPFSLSPSGAIALTGSASVTGDVQTSILFEVSPSAAIALSGAHSLSNGSLFFEQPFEVDYPIVLSVAGALSVSGDLAFVTSFLLTPTAAVAFSGAVAASGEPAIELALDGAVALAGTHAVSGALDVFGPREVTPTADVALASTLSLAGSVSYSIEFIVAPTQAVALAGSAAAAGAPGLGLELSGSVAMAGVAAVAGLPGLDIGLDGAAVALAGSAATNGAMDVFGPREVTPTAAVALEGALGVTGSLDIALPDSFTLAPTAALALAATASVSGAHGLHLGLSSSVALVASLAATGAAGLGIELDGTVTLTGAAGLTGEPEFIETAFSVSPTGAVALAGAVQTSSQVELGTHFDLAPTGPVALATTLQTAGGPLALEIAVTPAAAVALGATAALLGADLSWSTSHLVSPLAPLGLSGSLAAAGESTQPAWTASSRQRVGPGVTAAAGSRIGPEFAAPASSRVGGRRL